MRALRPSLRRARYRSGKRNENRDRGGVASWLDRRVFRRCELKGESLGELEAAFARWRSGKRHAREAIPRALVERARRAVRTHGVGRVARATKVDRGRLTGSGQEERDGESGVAMPSFSRVEVLAPVGRTPIAEIETAAGVKLRVFAETHETLGLLRAMCGIGGVR